MSRGAICQLEGRGPYENGGRAFQHPYLATFISHKDEGEKSKMGDVGEEPGTSFALLYSQPIGTHLFFPRGVTHNCRVVKVTLLGQNAWHFVKKTHLPFWIK